MSPLDNTQLLATFVPSIILALVAAGRWTDEKSRERQYARRLEVSHKQLDFLRAYLELQEKTATGEELTLTKEWVAKHTLTIQESMPLQPFVPPPDAPTAPDSSRRSLFARVFFLSRPEKFSALVYRLAFYGNAFMSVVGLGIGLTDSKYADDGNFWLGLVFYICLTVLFWYLTSRSSRKVA